MNETRLFYVVDSKEMNPEIFNTKEKAQAHYLSVLNTGTGRRIRICEVRNAYQESGPTGTWWNYDDLSDTFVTIKIIEEEL